MSNLSNRIFFQPAKPPRIQSLSSRSCHVPLNGAEAAAAAIVKLDLSRPETNFRMGFRGGARFVTALSYVLVVTMQLGGILGGHIEAVTLPDHLSTIECDPGSGYASEIISSSSTVREMQNEGWRLVRWDCQRDIYGKIER